MTRATLILPALLPKQQEPAPLPRLPYLERLLARADTSTATEDPIRFLYQCAGYTPEEGLDLPIAALTAAADFDTPPEGVLMRADPVHLHADMDRLLLFDAEHLELETEEVETLMNSVAEFLSEEDIELTRGKALERWYLHLPEPAAITTTELHRVQGRAIAHGLPNGPARETWVRRFNELQMLLFDHPVNRAREARSALTINSLWFWGQGERPLLPEPNPVSAVIGKQAELTGMARLIGAQEHDSLPQSLADDLVIWPQAFTDERVQADWRVYAECLEQLEREYIRPLYKHLASGKLDQLCLWTDGALYTMARTQRWRIWRRALPLVKREH